MYSNTPLNGIPRNYGARDEINNRRPLPPVYIRRLITHLVVQMHM